MLPVLGEDMQAGGSVHMGDRVETSGSVEMGGSVEAGDGGR